MQGLRSFYSLKSHLNLRIGQFGTNIEFKHLLIDGADVAVVLNNVNKSISLKLNIFLTNFLNRRRSQHDVNVVRSVYFPY